MQESLERVDKKKKFQGTNSSLAFGIEYPTKCNQNSICKFPWEKPEHTRLDIEKVCCTGRTFLSLRQTSSRIPLILVTRSRSSWKPHDPQQDCRIAPPSPGNRDIGCRRCSLCASSRLLRRRVSATNGIWSGISFLSINLGIRAMALKSPAPLGSPSIKTAR